jgi:hypothetical protein
MSSRLVASRTAALFTRMSRRPKRFTPALTIAATPASSVTSVRCATARPPRASISAATPSASAREARAFTITAAPASASASAIARPMLRPPPVTSATRPSSSRLVVTL